LPLSIFQIMPWERYDVMVAPYNTRFRYEGSHNYQLCYTLRRTIVEPKNPLLFIVIDETQN
jgi:hypothetical protein